MCDGKHLDHLRPRLSAFPSSGNGPGTFLLPNVGSPIYFDCVTSETVTRDADITEFPVETGANISDHYRVKLTAVKIEAFVSQEPVNEQFHPEGSPFWGAQTLVGMPQPVQSQGATIAKAILNPVGSALSVLGQAFDTAQHPFIAGPVLQYGAAFDSLQLLLERLDALRAGAVLITIYTKSQTYEGMVIGQSSPKGARKRTQHETRTPTSPRWATRGRRCARCPRTRPRSCRSWPAPSCPRRCPKILRRRIL